MVLAARVFTNVWAVDIAPTASSWAIHVDTDVIPLSTAVAVTVCAARVDASKVTVERALVKRLLTYILSLATAWLVVVIPVLKVDRFAEFATSVDTCVGP
jgi:hypothetical protein